MAEENNPIDSEELAWATLTPQQRFEEYSRLFTFYVASGGSLGPERDSQSPFDFEEYYERASRV